MKRFIVLLAIVVSLSLVGSLSVMGDDEVLNKDDAMSGLRIKLTSVFVDDQAKALEFYTSKLGFVKKEDISLGEFKWLTVVSALEPEGTELLLEPNVNEAAKTYQSALHEQGIPAAMFSVDDIQAEFERLKESGVEFTMEPTDVGTAFIAVFDDSCGNLIQIAQTK